MRQDRVFSLQLKKETDTSVFLRIFQHVSKHVFYGTPTSNQLQNCKISEAAVRRCSSK